jgi:hypothetical protein
VVLLLLCLRPCFNPLLLLLMDMFTRELLLEVKTGMFLLLCLVMLGLTGDLLDQLASALDGCVDLMDGLELLDGVQDLFVTEIIG